MLYQASPQLDSRMVEAEVDGSLQRIKEKFSLARLKGAKKSLLKKQVRRLID